MLVVLVVGDEDAHIVQNRGGTEQFALAWFAGEARDQVAFFAELVKEREGKRGDVFAVALLVAGLACEGADFSQDAGGVERLRALVCAVADHVADHAEQQTFAHAACEAVDAGCAGLLHEAFDGDQACDDDVGAVAGQAGLAESFGEGDAAEFVDERGELFVRNRAHFSQGGAVAVDHYAARSGGEGGERVEGAAAANEHGGRGCVVAYVVGDGAFDVAAEMFEVLACGEFGAAEGFGKANSTEGHGCAFGDDAIDAEDDFHGAAADINDGAEAVGEIEGASDGAVSMFTFVKA